MSRSKLALAAAFLAAEARALNLRGSPTSSVPETPRIGAQPLAALPPAMHNLGLQAALIQPPAL